MIIIRLQVNYDHENHIVHCYRFDNSGDLDWKIYKPYELVRGRVNLGNLLRQNHRAAIRVAINRSKGASDFDVGRKYLEDWTHRRNQNDEYCDIDLVNKTFERWVKCEEFKMRFH